MTSSRLKIVVAAALVLLGLGSAVPAVAGPFSRPLKKGSEGPDVRELEIRIAGWLRNSRQARLRIGGDFGHRTYRAVKSFQKAKHLKVDGVAGPQVFAALEKMESKDGSTKHFEWDEFDQNYNSRCGRKANKFAGTFKGGPLKPQKVRENVRHLMWRLEALRARGGGKPIGINSGFRSVPYNKCIGGASLSQHLYGNAADLRVVDANNRYTPQPRSLGPVLRDRLLLGLHSQPPRPASRERRPRRRPVLVVARPGLPRPRPGRRRSALLGRDRTQAGGCLAAQLDEGVRPGRRLGHPVAGRGPALQERGRALLPRPGRLSPYNLVTWSQSMCRVAPRASKTARASCTKAPQS